MRLFEAPFSASLAPAISVQSEPAENERKKNFYREGRITTNNFWCHSRPLLTIL
jgi:hypothetical protein